jgi:hypothetical protein
MHELPSSRGHAARVVIVLIIALAVAPLCVAALRARVLQSTVAAEPSVSAELPAAPAECGPHDAR